MTDHVALTPDHPYHGKTVAEIIHDYGKVRGDIGEGYAQDQLVHIFEARESRAWAALVRAEDEIRHRVIPKRPLTEDEFRGWKMALHQCLAALIEGTR